MARTACLLKDWKQAIHVFSNPYWWKGLFMSATSLSVAVTIPDIKDQRLSRAIYDAPTSLNMVIITVCSMVVITDLNMVIITTNIFWPKLSIKILQSSCSPMTWVRSWIYLRFSSSMWHSIEYIKIFNIQSKISLSKFFKLESQEAEKRDWFQICMIFGKIIFEQILYLV